MISSTKRPRALGRLTALLGSVAIIVAWAIPMAGMVAAAGETGSLSVNDISTPESAGTALFTVTRSGDLSGPATFSWSTADGTATATADYTTVPSTPVSFAPGESTKFLSVAIVNDGVYEGNETFFVNLTSTTNAITDSQGVGTIFESTAAPVFTIADAAPLAEGNSLTHEVYFVVTKTGATAVPATVFYYTSDGTATAGSDYQAKSGTLTFPAGNSSQTITINVIGDTVSEGDEVFYVNLSGATNATIGDNQGEHTILNDDGSPAFAIGNVTANEGNSGTTAFTFTVTLSPASSQTHSVNYVTANDTATGGATCGTAGTDYQSITGTNTLTFAPGETTKTITVNVCGDTLNELSEVFNVMLSGATNGASISDAAGDGNIVNDDAPPSLSINDVSATEGNAGTKTFTFTVTKTGSTASTVTFNWSTANGSANGGVCPANDYVAVPSGSGSIAAGATSTTVDVTVCGDTTVEPDESFFVILSANVNATIGDGSGTGTIVNDDGPKLSVNDVAVTEGNPTTPATTTPITFTVSMSETSTQVVSVDWATANNTAMAPSDYASASGTVFFNPGETVKTVTVQVNKDLVDEANETFFVNLSNPVNATILDGQGVGTITDDDAAPSLAINDVSANEGNSGTTAFTFTVTKTGATEQVVTVNYATADGSATAPSDYASASGTLTFAAGETTKTVTVLVNGDTSVEANETFFVNLTTPVNASISDFQGQGTIVNDDPNLSINDVSANEGNSGTTAFNFTVTLSAASASTVTVNYATLDGSASPPSDYTSTSGTLTFLPGETSKTITVNVNGDTTSESNETFTVNLSSPTNAFMGDSQGLGTIVNDDAAPPPPPTLCPGYESTTGNHIVGTAGNDIIYGTSGNDIICGLGGDDVIYGQDGNDTIIGGDGNDVLRGGTGRDTIYGEAGNDTLYGNRGWDYLNGGDGTDAGWGGRGSDTVANCESGQA